MLLYYMYKVTFDIYSGRPNPSVILNSNDATTAVSLLKSTKLKKQINVPSLTHLGYRGLIIEQLATNGRILKTMRVFNGNLILNNSRMSLVGSDFEDFICGNTKLFKKIKIRNFQKFVKRGLCKSRKDFLSDDFSTNKLVKIQNKPRIKQKTIDNDLNAYLPPLSVLDMWPRRIPWFKCLFCRDRFPKRCRCGPIYEPNWWNVGTIRPNNNCYNYATNYRTDTFAQPGKATNNKWTSLVCSNVKNSAISDFLVNTPTANNKCPNQGHLVALVIAQNHDYHWYRKDSTGYWSHKPGSQNVTHLDNSGNLITDPRSADRGVYTNFCTFMIVHHGHIIIK